MASIIHRRTINILRTFPFHFLVLYSGKRFFRLKMFFTLRKHGSFCSLKGFLKGSFPKIILQWNCYENSFLEPLFLTEYCLMSCKLLTDCLNWIDLRSVFHYTYCSKAAFQRKVPYKPNTAKGDSSKKNIQLLTHLDVNDALQFHLLDLVMLPAFFPPLFPLYISSVCRQETLWTDTPLSLSTFPSLSLFISLPLSGALLNSPTKPSVSVSTSPDRHIFPSAHLHLLKNPLGAVRVLSEQPVRSKTLTSRVTYMHATTMQKGKKERLNNFLQPEMFS